MIKETNIRVCPVENAGALDNSFRRLLQNPRKILKPFIRKGMTVLDLGCGPGFFSIEIAKMLEGSGTVIAADLQGEMLEKVNKKITRTALEHRIVLHKCETYNLGVIEKVDFILAFYMIHEIPDPNKIFETLKTILKPDGQLYIVEPKFHVSKKAFEIMINKLKNTGFDVIESPKVFFSRSALMTLKA